MILRAAAQGPVPQVTVPKAPPGVRALRVAMRRAGVRRSESGQWAWFRNGRWTRVTFEQAQDIGRAYLAGKL